MFRRAFLAATLLAATGVSAPAATADDIKLFVDVDMTAYLWNTTAADISFDGYQIASENNSLDVAGWYSLSDRIPGAIAELMADLGAGALGFGELSPTSAQIAEGNLTGVGVLKAGAKISLGKPFTSCDPGSVSFFYKIGGIPTQFPQTSEVWACPEPAAWLLAMLGAIFAAATKRRSRTRVQ